MRIRVLGSLENDGDELESPHSHGSVSSHPGRLPRQCDHCTHFPALFQRSTTEWAFHEFQHDENRQAVLRAVGKIGSTSRRINKPSP